MDGMNESFLHRFWNSPSLVDRTEVFGPARTELPSALMNSSPALYKAYLVNYEDISSRCCYAGHLQCPDRGMLMAFCFPCFRECLSFDRPTILKYFFVAITSTFEPNRYIFPGIVDWCFSGIVSDEVSPAKIVFDYTVQK